MKCNSCGEDKSEDLFSWQNKSAGIRQKKCKKCHQLYVAEHYQKNKETYVQRAIQSSAKYYDRNRKFLDEYRSNLKCIQCGEDHISTLDFHHVDSTEKDFTVAAFGSKSIKRIEEEIKKCVVLCANCHRKLHWNQRAQVTE